VTVGAALRPLSPRSQAPVSPSSLVRNLRDTRLYFVCGARPGGRTLEDVLRPALAGGVDLFQLREKDASDDELLRHAEVARSCCEEAGALFVLNDRPDLVAAAGADGVHVGQDDASVADARALVGRQRIVGLSTHSVDQVDAVGDVDLDYFAVGPVHATPTKEGRPAIGLDPIRHAAQTARRPWFAIGGLDPDTTPAVLDAGAERIVVVRAIAEAEDPGRAARTLRQMIDARHH
jgi:thiamine-phosphate pyrophosphorylase